MIILWLCKGTKFLGDDKTGGRIFVVMLRSVEVWLCSARTQQGKFDTGLNVISLQGAA